MRNFSNHKSNKNKYIGELSTRVISASEPSVDNIDSVGLRIVKVALHEAAEAAQIRGHARDSFDGTFSCRQKHTR